MIPVRHPLSDLAVVGVLCKGTELDARGNCLIKDISAQWAAARTEGERMSLLQSARDAILTGGEVVLIARNRIGRDRIRRQLRRLLDGVRALLGKPGMPGSSDLHTSSTGYSYLGYRRLLARAGYSSSEIHGLERNGQGELCELLPGAGSPDSTVWRTGWKARLQAFRAFAPEFLIRATVGGLPPSAFQMILQDIGERLSTARGGRREPAFHAIHVSQKEKLVTTACLDEERIIVKIPLTVAAELACAANCRALRLAQTFPGIAELIPAPLHEGRVSGFACTAESRMHGEPMSRWRVRGGASAGLGLVEQFLCRMHGEPSGHSRRRLEKHFYNQLIERRLTAAEHVWPDADSPRVIRDYFDAMLRGRTLVTGLTHGDLSLSNVFVNRGAISGVIDWDDSEVEGLPVLDAISHVCSLKFREQGDYATTFTSLAEERQPASAENAFLSRMFRFFGVEAELHRPLVLLYWLASIAAHAKYGYASNPSFRCERVEPFVRQIRESVRQAGIGR